MTLRLLFAAGGTGGHIFPAMAVADRCRELHPDVEIEFVGTRGRLEEKVVPRGGYRLNFLWISGLERKLSPRAAILPLKIVASFAQALRLLSRFRPDAVICAGAYVSYPIGMMAAFRKIPLVLMESNALPGLVVRKLFVKAAETHVAFAATAERLKGSGPGNVFVSGNPVRGIFFAPKISPAEARRHFGLDPARPTLLAFGGSLGARSVNIALDAIIGPLLDEGVQVIWQTGTSYGGGERKEPNLYRATFIHEMEMAYAAADLVLARAGATTIAELAAVGKPSLLVPLASAADDHQRVNAETLKMAGAAEMLLDSELSARLLPVLEDLLGDPVSLEKMGQAVAEMAIPDADRTIAARVLALAERGRG